MGLFNFVPEVTSIESIYPAESQSRQQLRWDHLLARFQESYGYPAEFISRAPGRVNIIGEVKHLLFLPTTILRCLLAAH